VEGYEEMGIFTVMCSISTFSALCITLVLLFVSKRVC
jgi:hypothetical protein